MSKIQSAWLFVSKHRYLVTIFVIALIVGVVDQDSLLNRQPRRARIDMMRQEIAHYKAQYEKADRKIRLLESSPAAVEKIARERYFMKRDDEDVFIVVGRHTGADDHSADSETE